MGLLDDLAMGFGMKERTEDYDARTAKGVAVGNATSNAPNQQVAGMMTSILNSGGTISPSSSMYKYMNASDFGGSGNDYNMESLINKGSAYSKYFDDRGYESGYIPSVGSTETAPNPYAIGPLTMDQPLPSFGLLGLFTNGLGGMFGRDSGNDMGPARTTVRPRLRPDDLNVPLDTHIPMEAGMGRFEDPEARAARSALAGGMPTPDLSPKVIKKLSQETQESLLDIPDAASMTVGLAPENVNKPDPAFPVDLAKKYSEAALGAMDQDMIDYLKRVELEESGYTYLDSGPHAGKYMDASGKIVSF